jgi:TPR repeat protein
MDLSHDDKRILVALIWSLKRSDLSVLHAYLAEEREGLIGTGKNSGNDIFYSKLESLGLAQQVALESDLPAGALTNTRTFSLDAAAKAEIKPLMAVALNSGDPPEEGNMCAEAIRMLNQYAADGDASSQNKLGLLYEKGQGVEQDNAAALRWYRKAAAAGDMKAHNNIGVMYFAGAGVPKNLDEAIEWLIRAADLGSTGAMDNLGEMYLRGLGVPRDHAQALKWFLKAAERGHGQASYKAGWLYSVGQGAPQDYVQAYLWFSVAIAARVNAAQYLDDVASKMTPAQIEEAKALVSQWRAHEDDGR